MTKDADFKKHLDEAGILDPEGEHHELSGGMHGQKLDFSRIPAAGELFNEWVEVTAREINRRFLTKNIGKLAVLSVAGGTNELTPRVADWLGGGTVSLLTEKSPGGFVRLSSDAKRWIQEVPFDLVVVVEDVGTTGKNSAAAAQAAILAGAGAVEVLITWQRRKKLEELQTTGIHYHAIIDEPLPTFTSEECREQGFCAQGWKLIQK